MCIIYSSTLFHFYNTTEIFPAWELPRNNTADLQWQPSSLPCRMLFFPSSTIHAHTHVKTKKPLRQNKHWKHEHDITI
jgi:hypothetical protein